MMGQDQCPICVCPLGSEVHGSVICVESLDGIEGSVMIFPRVHRTSFREMTEQERCDTFTAVDRRMQRWSDGGVASAANLMWNLGANAGQSIEHIHAHLVPRRQGELLDGYGARWWLKRGVRYRSLLRWVAHRNPQDFPEHLKARWTQL